MTMAALADHVRLLQRLPRETRAFSHDAPRAEAEFGISAELLEACVAAGLPHVEADGVTRFDWRDLHYLGLRLALPSAHTKALRAWARTFEQLATGAATGARVRYFSSGPTGERPARVLVPSGTIAATATRGVPLADYTTAEQPSQRLDGPAAAVVRDVARTHFYLLPPSLSGDVELARTTGLSDCLTAARMVVAGCAEQGVEAREAFGLLLSTPLSTPHSWAEIRVEGAWVAVDALLVSLLERFGARPWPATDTIGRFVVRLADRPAPIASAGEEELPTLLTTDLLRPPSDQSS